ncbi:putative ribonuclease H-like domain-containing protein [Tanacetum coccineum]
MPSYCSRLSEVLDQTFDRLQKLISQLEIYGESISQEDVNLKFLKSLSPEWNTHTIVWRNKPEIDTLSLNDLYNNMKIYESEVKGTPSSSTNTQNVAFVSSNSTNSINRAVNTAHGVTTASTQATAVNSTTFDKLSDAVIYWSDQHKRSTNFALMAYTSTSSNSEVLIKCEIHLREVAITELRRKLELAQKQKDEIQLTVEKLENSSKRNFMPLKPDLSFFGLEESLYEPIVSEPTVKKPVVETSEAKTSKAKPKVVRKNNGALIIEDLVSDRNQVYADKKASDLLGFGKPKTKGNPQMDLQNQGVIDSRCSSHMTGNMSYLTDFEELDDETSGILKSFITGVENLIDQRVKVIRCDNRTEFKNKEMNQFCERKVVAGNQSNGNPGTKACDEQVKARIKIIPGKDYILLPLWNVDPSFSQSSKSSPDAGFKPSRDDDKPSGDDEKKGDENPRKESESNDQEKEDNVNSTNNVNAASTNEVNAVGAKTSIELPDDPNMPELEDIVYSDDDEDVGAEADLNNLNTFMHVSPIPTTRIHKDHIVEQIIGDLNSAPQTRRMTKNLEEHEEPKKVIHALKDLSWIEAMQDELLQFKLQKVWTLADLPNGKRPIGTKWVYRNKNDKRGIVIKNKARLVAQGYTQEEGLTMMKSFPLLPELKQLGYS